MASVSSSLRGMHSLLAVLVLSAAPAGKLTVLWPRIIPSAQAEATAQLAKDAQVQVALAAKRALPEREHEFKPKGERSCPEQGCPAGSVGVLIIRDGEACAAVALVGVEGRGHVRLAAWAGTIELKKYEVEFREPPESSVRVRDFIKCSELVAAMEKPNVDVERAMVDMLRVK